MLITPTIEIEKVNDQIWDVYALTSTPVHANKRKKFAQFCKDVDGDWLLFFTGTGGLQRHHIAELSAAFARFIPNTYPGV